MATQLIAEEKMMIEVVRDLAREKVAPRAAEIDAQGEFPWDMKELLADQGILGMPFPEEYGGLGSSELSILMVIEELARLNVGVRIYEHGKTLRCVRGMQGASARLSRSGEDYRRNAALQSNTAREGHLARSGLTAS